jgi:hypothetical protein
MEDLGTVGPLPGIHPTLLTRGGPRLLVALPEYWEHPPGADADVLLHEWAASLHPTAALREFVIELINVETRLISDGELELIRWVIRDDVHVEPSAEALRWLRDAAVNEKLVSTFKDLPGVLLHHPEADEEAPFRRLTAWDDERTADVLTHEALPVLIGMVVIAVIEHPVGIHGRRIALGLK